MAAFPRRPCTYGRHSLPLHPLRSGGRPRLGASSPPSWRPSAPRCQHQAGVDSSPPCAAALWSLPPGRRCRRACGVPPSPPSPRDGRPTPGVGDALPSWCSARSVAAAISSRRSPSAAAAGAAAVAAPSLPSPFCSTWPPSSVLTASSRGGPPRSLMLPPPSSSLLPPSFLRPPAALPVPSLLLELTLLWCRRFCHCHLPLGPCVSPQPRACRSVAIPTPSALSPSRRC